MNRLMIILLGSFFFWLSCKNTDPGETKAADDHFEPKGGVSDLVYNPVRPDGTIDSSFLPILAWQEDVYEFGTITEGDVVTHEYHFTNTGTAPLLITDAKSSCGCTIPEWPKKPIPPDSTGSILVKFNSLHKTGSQSKEVTIFANTFPNQSKITIKGRVEKTN